MAKKKNEITIRSSAAEYLTYVATINEHISNIYKDNELEKESTIRNFLIVQKEGIREVSRNGTHTIDVADKLGFGTKEYELINIE